MLEYSSVDVVVCWIAIDELVEEDGVEWHSPVNRTRMKVMIVPFAVVICNVNSRAVLVEIVVLKLFLET